MDDPDLYSLPGYRFSPTDDELIEDYLKLKITGKDNKNTWRIPEIDIYKYEPWDLPSFARIPTKDKVWYFITPQSLKHKNGNGMNRSTEKGYWKSTGKDRKIKSGGEVIAMKKSLGYHIGRSPNGERTEWKMYEYRTTQKEFDGKHPGQKAWVLIRLFVDREKNTKGGPAVSLDTTFCIEETKSKSSLAPVSPALEVQAETHQTKKQEAEMTSSEDGFNVDEMISDATEPVQFKNDNYNYQNAYVAEKQRAEMTSSEDDCNVKKYLNMFSPSAFDFNADEMMFDDTAPVQFKNDDFNSEVDFNVEENLNEFCFTPPDDSPSSLLSITPDVSTFISNKSSYEETQSEPTLAPASQALLEQAEKHPTNGRTRFYIVPPLACNNGYNAYTAENQVAEVEATEFELEMEEALKMFYPHPPEPLDCNFSSPSTSTFVTPAVSFTTSVKASLEEAQSMLVPASVSPELGSEADNYPRCCPAENSDAITSSTIPPIKYNGYNTNVSKEVAEITSDEVEAGLNMFPVTPQPLGCNMLCPLHSHMQADLGSSCISYPFTNDLNSGHWGVHHQSGTNESAPNISESWDLTPYNPDDCFCYKYSSQNNLAFDDETQENMVSVKDNGSCRSSDAIAEFELKYQDLLWLEEIINPKVSPGLLKSGSYLGSEGGSSDQIIGSD
ncbi:NAC domain containing protein 50 isoform X2 [Quercus suber]|uniref:NAC domain containing protein 50 isoform X2 n=1 Tax=Quercus suber TaxID=58331 RepID=UPI000CE195B2|nr:NAC domain containing protein 50-like isoform X1 [Quercus suber]POF09688.1 nac domain-containing protein 14 [Quercus suber]